MWYAIEFFIALGAGLGISLNSMDYLKKMGFNDSMTTAKTFLEKADIIATPGVGFGKAGEGYIRMTLTVPKERLNEAVERLQKIL